MSQGTDRTAYTIEDRQTRRTLEEEEDRERKRETAVSRESLIVHRGGEED